MTSEPQERPAYSLSEAARILRLPVATLRSWTVGRPYPRGAGVARFHPLLHPPVERPPTLSFSNLIEAHVLRSLRTDHAVSLKHVRSALAYAEKHLRIERLLLDERLRTDAGHLLLERYGKLIDLSASGQMAMRRMFDEHLQRIEWDRKHVPARLFPFLSAQASSPTRSIVIDPRIAFGRPIVARRSISTQVIRDRIDAGEALKAVAEDYGLRPEEIEEAIFYERAA